MELQKPICESCIHFTPFSGGCKAFHGGIPAEILESNKHDKPIKGQNNDFVHTPDPIKFNGEWLYYYYTTDHPDKEYASIVKLLPYATGDINKAYSILEECEKTGKRLFAVYSNENTDTSMLTYIGAIIDGALYSG